MIIRAECDDVCALLIKPTTTPIAVIDGDPSRDVLIRKVKQGQSISLDARSSQDPDGDMLSFSWWIYHEASTVSALITDSQEEIVHIEIPEQSISGEVHVILETTDDGDPKLFAFRRIILIIDR